MGQCLCKKKTQDENSYTRSGGGDAVGAACSRGSHNSDPEHYTQKQVDDLVLETLVVIRTKVEIEPDPPDSLIKLNNVAEKEEGWIQLVRSFVNVIPVSDPLGPAVMSLLLDDCPLPTRETALKCLELLETLPRDNNTKQHRNLMIVLGCIAEKLAGPNSVALLTHDILSYLIRNLDVDTPPSLILFSLIALEKFTQTSENKSKIRKKLSVIPESCNPLVLLEKFVDTNEDYVLRQVGFCAQWSLDNLLPVENRMYSYQTTDTSNINMMLNSNDVSEYLKLGPNGLVARCDASSFESVRCTGQADTGCWYYEVLVVTSGVMQIGWATKQSKFLNHDGFGIGDDEYSQAYDGCRQLMWHNAVSESVGKLPRWVPGDTVGCFIDIPRQSVKFSLNGVNLKPYNQLFNNAKSGFFPAASFMSFQQCEFNFGWKPYKYPPDVSFSSFNEVRTLNAEEKIILPRPLRLAALQKDPVKEDACTLCFDNKANTTIHPCQHKGFCDTCANQISVCPMCRGIIMSLHISLPGQTSKRSSFRREGSPEILPPHASSSEIPPIHASSSEIPPQLASSSKIPPHLASSSEIPPQLASISEIPPQLANSSQIPPQHANSSEIPSQLANSSKASEDATPLQSAHSSTDNQEMSSTSRLDKEIVSETSAASAASIDIVLTEHSETMFHSVYAQSEDIDDNQSSFLSSYNPETSFRSCDTREEFSQINLDDSAS